MPAAGRHRTGAPPPGDQETGQGAAEDQPDDRNLADPRHGPRHDERRPGRGAAGDLLTWCTSEFGYLRLADGFVQCSTIMPQKRNPVALEHARAIGSKAVGQAQAIALVVHNTPFGDCSAGRSTSTRRSSPAF